ncbi:hypothetical protein PBCV1_a149L [Paramecium bursaria Chlorella virus 1]|uniref:Uncharacterized protein n=1 Tax=Paramecium bursaria Chlorella virus 1 TaxID=10506 RepID=Q84469_PBCV1|nr:hypothetical protein PBCV1_a149L [Paramecium bursaria Chlorella virus 1]AAC96517.1 hypothetical protein [Paramecium bursaria Chlorella virus 1]
MPYSRRCFKKLQVLCMINLSIMMNQVLKVMTKVMTKVMKNQVMKLMILTWITYSQRHSENLRRTHSSNNNRYSTGNARGLQKHNCGACRFDSQTMTFLVKRPGRFFSTIIRVFETYSQPIGAFNRNYRARHTHVIP